jgi:hypothetical protein
VMKSEGLSALQREGLDERQMQRWIGAVDLSEHALSDGASDSARRQYADHHPEQSLLAFVLNETN